MLLRTGNTNPHKSNRPAKLRRFLQVVVSGMRRRSPAPKPSELMRRRTPDTTNDFSAKAFAIPAACAVFVRPFPDFASAAPTMRGRPSVLVGSLCKLISLKKVRKLYKRSWPHHPCCRSPCTPPPPDAGIMVAGCLLSTHLALARLRYAFIPFRKPTDYFPLS